ncbi:hypothetical protein F183_A32090 [Bryobacterales bacterium F-183]|nr:hypothetical protein F183_A32090 [Bryobacterales bacterium F-183]
MAGQAAVKDLTRFFLRERKDLRFVAFGLNVRFAWSVAPFAALLLKRNGRVDKCFLMRIPIESGVNVGMTGPAS